MHLNKHVTSLMFTKHLAIFLGSFFLLTSCHSKQNSNTASQTANKDSLAIAAAPTISDKDIKQDSTLQAYSLFLAGMTKKSTAGIPDKLWNNSFYKKYAAMMDSNFTRIEKDRLSKMRNWASTELKDELANPKVLFYPFSGPDMLHAITFYPNSPEYVMTAMERYGNLPDFGKMDSSHTAYYLNSAKESLQDIFNKSYFITHKMITELEKQKVNGVTPLICVFLVRTGHIVVAVKKKHLKEDGSIVELARDSLPGGNNDFIEIYFKDNDSSGLRKIQYFRANLGDEAFGGLPSLPSNKTLQKYYNSLPEFYTYVKSASYLMNYKTFSCIRDICLNKSKSILQDDTGIGFPYFDKNKWNVKLYGHYAQPVKDFKGVYDVKLAEAYKKDSTNVKALDFSLGYHWGNQREQNLIKAERK
jgi:hypothetical protein